MGGIPDGEREAHLRVSEILEATFKPTGLAARFPKSDNIVEMRSHEHQSFFNKIAITFVSFLSSLGK